MKGIVALCLLVALTGCSAKQVRPETTASQLFRTPIDGASAQLVLSEDFQRKVITQKPTYGRSWSPFEFEVPVGEPLSKAMVLDMRARVPGARVGNTDDGKPATVRVVPSQIALEFGVDDGSAVAWSSIGLLGLGADIVVGAKATVTSTISVNGAAPRQVSVTGVGAIPMAYISLREADIGKAIGLALDDAALKLGELAEADAKRL